MAILESSIMNLYLEDFNNFCLTLNSETADIMSEILSERADQISMNITLNSFGTQLGEVNLEIKSKGVT